MSTEKRVTFTEHGEPVVAVKITGYDDAFRFAWALAHLQCDFAGLGRRIGASLRRRLGAHDFRALHERYTSNETIAWARGDVERSDAIEAVWETGIFGCELCPEDGRWCAACGNDIGIVVDAALSALAATPYVEGEGP